MTRAEWIALAKRCEKATGPNYALEQDIALAGSFGDSALSPPPVTYSIDAITTMIGRELPDRAYWFASHTPTGEPTPKAAVYVPFGKSHIEQATTPALALCAAFCKAMSERVDE